MLSLSYSPAPPLFLSFNLTLLEDNFFPTPSASPEATLDSTDHSPPPHMPSSLSDPAHSQVWDREREDGSPAPSSPLSRE